jgi:surface antigen
VGDGKTYVWRRWHGRLSGIVQPTASFKDNGGKVCRHLIVLMTTGANTKKQEGIACRLPSGRWQLDG